jgi:hypothetical protein
VADIVFNIAKGRIASYVALPAANDALVVVLLEASGLEADSALRDYADLATLLAGANNEQTVMGRKTVTATTVTVDNTNDRVDLDFADLVWTAATGNPIGALVVCYDPDTTGGTDSSLVPLTKHDLALTPDGTDFTAVLAAAGFARAA